MPVLTTSSLRARLISAVVLTILPLLCLMWYGARRQFERETAAIERQVKRMTAVVTGDVSLLLETTRQTLAAVAEVHRTAPPEAAAAIVAGMARRCPYYTAFAVMDPTGRTCRAYATDGTSAGTYDEDMVSRAAATMSVAVGRSTIARGNNRNLLAAAYAERLQAGAESALVACVVLDLEWLEVLLAEEKMTGTMSLFPPEMTLNILDRSGTVLTRYPDRERWAGRSFPETGVLQEILRKGEGSAELTGVDGVRRFYAFQSVKASGNDILVCTGVSKDSALAPTRTTLYTGLAGVLAVGILLIVAAWYAVGFLVARPVGALVAAAHRLSDGDLSARTGVRNGPTEIIHLAGAFDGMAEGLQRNARERDAMQAKLVEYDRQLRSMTVEAALAEEQERKQIAAGIHDKAGPLLASCYMKLGRAMKLPLPEGAAAAVQESRELIDKATAELRSLTFDLSSPTLYALGLAPAVEQLCSDVAGHHGIRVSFSDRGTPPDLGSDWRVILYRAAQELLLNVVKHAEATNVSVTCGGDAEEVFISVSDDGVGFDAAGVGRGFSRTGGFGLFNIREKVAHLGGRFEVKSARGSGTHVLIALPNRSDGASREDDNADQDTAG